MIIKNITKNTIISSDAQEATSLIDKSIGLLSSNDPKALMFKTRFGIHTFGMKYAIDVLILDSQMKVTKVKKTLVPNKIFTWNPKFITVIELPSGVIDKTKSQVGDHLEIIPSF